MMELPIIPGIKDPTMMTIDQQQGSLKNASFEKNLKSDYPKFIKQANKINKQRGFPKIFSKKNSLQPIPVSRYQKSSSSSSYFLEQQQLEEEIRKNLSYIESGIDNAARCTKDKYFSSTLKNKFQYQKPNTVGCITGKKKQNSRYINTSPWNAKLNDNKSYSNNNNNNNNSFQDNEFNINNLFEFSDLEDETSYRSQIENKFQQTYYTNRSLHSPDAKSSNKQSKITSNKTKKQSHSKQKIGNHPRSVSKEELLQKLPQYTRQAYKVARMPRYKNGKRPLSPISLLKEKLKKLQDGEI